MSPASLRAELRDRVGELDLAVTLEVGPGECLALAGPSGSGKSTVLRIVAGLRRPTDGRVTLGEEVWLDTHRGVDVPPEQRRTGFVFQDYALFEHLSAWRNVAYPLTSVARGQRRGRAIELLSRLGLADRADSPPSALSGGERQRVALARALAREPSVLLLDEPLAALDPVARAAAAHALQAVMREEGLPAVLVTHDFNQAATLGERVAVIERGRVVQQGTAARLAAEPETSFVADFTGAVVLRGQARPGHDGLTIVELEGGGSVVSPTEAQGEVSLSLFPWDIVLEPACSEATGSARNHLPAEVVSVTEIGGRVRVGLRCPQPLVAEVTAISARELGLRPGERVLASWKATAMRLVADR